MGLIEFVSISWIEPRPNPITKATDAIDYKPNWIPKAALGLMATSNTAPIDGLNDVLGFLAAKDYRAITLCTLSIDIDAATDRITSARYVQQLDGGRTLDTLAEAGYTPPFSVEKLRQNGVTVDRLDEIGMPSVPKIMQRHVQGETSPISSVVIGARHPNTAITIPNDHTVLCNSLVKVRASGVEDAVGVGPEVGAPNHVPWVWCELLATYDSGHGDQRKFWLWGRGSIFPSHTWMLTGARHATLIQAADTRFPVLPGGAKLLKESEMILPRFFRVGAPATGPQTPLSAEAPLTGPVDTHPHTAPGGETICVEF